MADIFDELIGGGAPPQELVSVLRRQRALGQIGALSGDKNIARMGGATYDDSMKQATDIRDRRDSSAARQAQQQLAMQQQEMASADRKSQRDYQYTALKQAGDIARAQMDNAREIAGLKGAAKPPSDGDKKARLLGSEMFGAEAQLRSVGGNDAAPSGWDSALDSNPLTRGMTGESYRQQQAAAERWASNLLYIKSGAAAGADEIRKTAIQYTPQRGDTDAVIKQKAQARKEQMDAIGGIYGMEVPDFDAADTAPQSPALPQAAVSRAAPNKVKKWGDLP
jgi:hypothetical protein